MNHELFFSAFSVAAMIGWLALASAPLRRDLLIRSAQAIAVALSAGYLALFVLSRQNGPAPDFSSLAAVQLGFESPSRLLGGWTHFLAFDLLIGAWQAEDAHRRGIPHLLVVPCLALTFMFGPMGLLVFLALREGFRLLRRGSGEISASAH